MPIVKSLVNLIGGNISVESEQGKGTQFTIGFCLRIANPEDFSEKISSPTNSANIKGKSILLAEDNELNAEIALEILKEAGFKVHRVCDGEECLTEITQANASTYDLILMDVQMPKMDGYMATQAIRRLNDESRNKIPIIAMTANAFEEDRKNAMAAGMNGHVAKPIDVQMLMKTIQEILG